MSANASAIPFSGERMVCLLCGREEISNPTVSSQWRCVRLDNRTFYACPNEFPADGARAEQFMRAYKRFILEAAKKAKERQP